MVGNVLDIGDLLIYDSVRMILKAILLKQGGSGDPLYESAIAKAVEEKNEDKEATINYGAILTSAFAKTSKRTEEVSLDDNKNDESEASDNEESEETTEPSSSNGAKRSKGDSNEHKKKIMKMDAV
ncbi:hypothetical protein DPMN_099227 [Dreissena polymorpha]|uniref:Uncharacterized protein n=1 Tax=Dreissena polymorpha TaxID=45954 RepID=A0A9D4R802_DREPO|nr:hypothetical protein DPMN_099227 [Dreissena polymorpha]